MLAWKEERNYNAMVRLNFFILYAPAILFSH